MKSIVAGNWKMNLGLAESNDLATALAQGYQRNPNVELWIAPSAHTLEAVSKTVTPHGIQVGSQNVHWEAKGAFTGELSAPMLKECGCSFSLVGHSERRQAFGESDAMIAKRCLGALRADLTAVLCIGETLAEREAGDTNNVLERQLGAVVPALSESEASSLVIAYEPVWAIGTGKVASIDEIASAHTFIADYLKNNCAQKTIPLLYGGSVSPDNFKDIIAVPEVHGALVGGASLDAEKFLGVFEIACNS